MPSGTVVRQPAPNKPPQQKNNALRLHYERPHHNSNRTSPPDDGLLDLAPELPAVIGAVAALGDELVHIDRPFALGSMIVTSPCLPRVSEPFSMPMILAGLAVIIRIRPDQSRIFGSISALM